MKYFRFTRSARRAIALLCVFIFTLLLYKHISQERRQSQSINELQTRVATLENARNAQQPSAPATAVIPDDAHRKTDSGPPSAISGTQTAAQTSHHINTHSRTTVTTNNAVNTPSGKNATAAPTLKAGKNPDETASYTRTAASGNYLPKFKAPHTVELNTADSITLIRIPGIGAATAGAILRYRSRLGGYTSARQVAEAARWASASQINTWCRDWFTADTTLVTRIKINRADFSTLLRHPYLSYAQVCAISDLRRTHGRIRTLAELKLLTEFSETDLARLAPYLSFQ